MYEFQSESILYSLPEYQGTLARSRCHIRSLSDSNGIQTVGEYTTLQINIIPVLVTMNRKITKPLVKLNCWWLQ